MLRAMPMARILLVEDDDAIATGLERVLAGQGHRVRRVGRGGEALASLDGVALILLDLGLPDMDGLDVCRMARAARPQVAIVILTARDTELDVVSGLDAGADDYLVKPVRLSELLARVRAHLRRVERPADTTAAGELLTAGALRVDLAARRAWNGDVELTLRPKELDLLAVLVAHAGRVVTRERLMREVWRTDWLGATKTLDTHVLSLRAKLGDPSVIATLRGVGYRLDAG
jgi:DNA-binding response OmpR family regulator